MTSGYLRGSSNLLAGASGQSGGYTIENSLRFRASASSYLSRTFGSGGNLKTYTISFWIKRGKLGSQQFAFTGFNGSISGNIQFTSSDTLTFNVDGGVNYQLITTQVFRDPSAWYHVVCVADTTQATPSNRLKIYVNGVQVTSFGTATYPTLNYDTKFFGAYSHWIGASQIPSLYTDGYLAEFNAIDGQALPPSDFGEYNEDTGVWQPVAYAGTYGTNGFYLPFSDATNTTTLVADSSGNGNDWTPNGISLTAGATYDSMTDTPTIYAGGGNYAVMNPVHKSANATVSDGNLKIRSAVTGANNFSIATITLPTDKVYFEVTAGNNTGAVVVCEVGLVVPTTQTFAGTNSGIQCVNGGLNKIVNGVYTSIGGGLTTGTVLGFAYDLVNGLMTIYRDGTAVATDETIPTTFRAVLASVYRDTANDVGWEFNFGQRPFAYTPPTGFKSLHTGNLPDSTIVDGSEYFDVVLRTGTGTADGQSQVISNLAFTPDLVWNKARSNAFNHNLVDSVRGNDALLLSNSTNAETSVGITGTQLQITANGFTAIQRVSYNATNQNGVTYADWCWKAGGAAVTNELGSITSQVSADTTAGFSIVTYTADGVATATIGHGLGATPDMIITFGRTGGSTNHAVYHSSLPNASSSMVWLDLAAAAVTNAGYWNATAPTATVFSGGATGNYVNNTGWTMVAYCFAEVEGYSKIGVWQNNNSTDGTFVYLGFRPRFILLKNYDNAESWYIWDSVRQTYNVPPPSNNWLSPRLPNAEAANSVTTAAIDGLSNGFKIRTTNPASGEISFGTRNYIYMAFAENPFKNSLAR